MPIHDQGYRRYRGGRAGPGAAWLVIARAGLRALLGRKVFLALLLVSWLPLVIRVAQLYVAVSVPQAAMLAATPLLFRDFLDQQGIFLFFVTVYVGSGLVAADRRTNALQLYLSRPLSRVEYVGGKLAILMACQLLVTWVPAMVLLLAQIAVSGSFAFVQANLFLVPAITLHAFTQVGIAAVTILALSSLSTSGRFVGILYAGLVLFSDALFAVLRAITRSTAAAWVSVPANIAQVGDVVFRQQPRYELAWMVSVLVLTLVLAASMAILARRIRGVEVVA